MTNLELSLLMGFWPIIYFFLYLVMHQNLIGKRIKTKALEISGEVIKSEYTHSLIEFDDGSTFWLRNTFFEEDKDDGRR